MWLYLAVWRLTLLYKVSAGRTGVRSGLSGPFLHCGAVAFIATPDLLAELCACHAYHMALTNVQPIELQPSRLPIRDTLPLHPTTLRLPSRTP
jgi:hypothetical protein